MTGRKDLLASLDLALRVGEVLLRSGAGAADVSASMQAVARACGLGHATADVTFVDLAMRYQASPDQPVVIQMRRVVQRPVDYTELIETDQIVHDLVAGAITCAEAHARVRAVLSTGHDRSRWAVMLGWGAMGTGIALTLGGNVVVCALAFVAACAIDATELLLPVRRIPAFYQQVAGGFVATVIAILASEAGLEVNPSRVITTGIVLLLAGIGIMGATQDAITGFPVTASARMIDALLNTAGIIGGVSAGLAFGTLLGIGPTSITVGASGFAAVGVTLAGAGLAGAAFAFACYAPLRACAAVGPVAILGQAALLAVASSSLGRTWGAAAAAVSIGAVSFLAAERFRVPPLVVVVPAIVPLLPGLAIYRGLALLAVGEDGVLQLVSALATALALAAGVILGQYVARPVRREAHWLETRLSGPRMVGPFHHRDATPDR